MKLARMRVPMPRLFANRPDAAKSRDVAATRRNHSQYGFGVSGEQEITARSVPSQDLAGTYGKTESFAYTAIDRHATGGISISGQALHRPFDTAATEVTAAGISGVHALYLGAVATTS